MTSLHAARAFSATSALCLALAPLTLLLMAAPVGAAAGHLVHSYEEFLPQGNSGQVGSFYSGFVYSGDDNVYCSYNSGGFPTGTQPCVVLPTSSGVVDIAAEVPIVSFEIDVATGGSSTVTIEGFDFLGFPVASNTCGSAYGAFVRCGIVGPEMTTLRVSGSAGSYVFDTATFIASEDGGQPNPAVHNNPDGTCTIYDDQNGDGTVDAGEALATVPCALGDVPLNVPAQSLSQTLPGLSSPNVPATPVTTPPVGIPATCTASVCTLPTSIPAQSTPPLPQVCVPLVVCLGPVAPQPLTPPVTVPPLCTVAGPICLPPTTLVPSQTVTVPGQPPIPLTPAITVSVSSTGFTGLVEPNAGELSSIGPITTMVGPIPVTLCPSTCPVPVPPGASLSGSITVTVTVGTTTHTQTVPVNL